MQALLKKAATLDIRMICPLHVRVWRKNIGWFVDKYSKWSSYTPEQDGSVLIAYSSVYGHTENAAQVLATMLAGRGVRNIAMYDVSVTHPSYVVARPSAAATSCSRPRRTTPASSATWRRRCSTSRHTTSRTAPSP